MRVRETETERNGLIGRRGRCGNKWFDDRDRKSKQSRRRWREKQNAITMTKMSQREEARGTMAGRDEQRTTTEKWRRPDNGGQIMAVAVEYQQGRTMAIIVTTDNQRQQWPISNGGGRKLAATTIKNRQTIAEQGLNEGTDRRPNNGRSNGWTETMAIATEMVGQ